MADIVNLNGYKIKDEKAVRSYDTIASMKADTKLKEGYYVKTKGYHEANDGGSAEYLIIDDNTLVDDGGSIHVLSNGLRAKLIINDGINVKQFGAKGDNLTDDTTAFINAFKFHNVVIPEGNYIIDATNNEDTTFNYLIEGKIELLSNSNITISPNAFIKVKTNNADKYALFMIKNVENVTITGGNLIGDRTTHTGATGEWGYGISLLGAKNINIENINISNMWGDGINLQFYNYDNDNVIIRDVVCDNNRRQGISIESGTNISILDSNLLNTNGTLPENGIDIEPSINNSVVDNVLINNCLFKNNAKQSITINGTHGNVKNVTVSNSYLGIPTDYSTNLQIGMSSFINVNNNIIESAINGNYDTNNIYIYNSNNLKMNNNNIKDLGILMVSSADVTISHNNFNMGISGNENVMPLKFSGCTNVLITDNNIKCTANDTVNYCIFTYGANSKIKIIRNLIDYFGSVIYINNGTDFYIKDNYFKNIKSVVIQISGSSAESLNTNTNIFNNMFENCCFNNSDGIAVYVVKNTTGLKFIDNEFLKTSQNNENLGSYAVSKMIFVVDNNNVNGLLRFRQIDSSLTYTNNSSTFNVLT